MNVRLSLTIQRTKGKIVCFVLSLNPFNTSSLSGCDPSRRLGVRERSSGLRRLLSVDRGSLVPVVSGSGVLALYGLIER